MCSGHPPARCGRGDLVTLIERLPAGVYADAQNLWLLLSFQQKENAPTRDAVEDVVAILASKAVGVLRAINGSGEYQMTMQADTAIRRLGALSRALGGQDVVAGAPDTVQVAPRVAPPKRLPSPERASATTGDVDFSSARESLLQQLQALGFGTPYRISRRHVRLTRGAKSLGLAFRGSKRYTDGKWWWTFTEAADHAPLADCDAIVLVGLMQDPGNPTTARPDG